MTPISSLLYMAYIGLVYTIIGGYFRERPMILPDFYNVGFGKFGAAMTLSYGASAMSFLIYMIVPVGIPTKIGKMIVISISIFMTSLHSLGAWAHKGQKQNTVNKNVFLEPVFIKIRPHVFHAPRLTWAKNFFFYFERFCSAKIADLVGALVPRNIFPDFIHMREILA